LWESVKLNIENKGGFRSLLMFLVLGALNFGSVPNLTSEDVNALVDFYRGFEPNLGQLGDFDGNKVRDVIFFTRDKDLGVFITDKGASYVIYRVEGDVSGEKGVKGERAVDNQSDVKLRYARVDVELEGGSISGREVEYEDEIPGYTNYYLAHCPEGVLNVKSYRRVRIKGVYPGIDWVWKYEGGRLHHEFEVEPGANVGSIKLRVKWGDVEVRDGGKRVVLRTPIGDIEDGEVVGYEVRSGSKVKVSYVINGDGSISFRVEGYRGRDKLVIDPPLGLLWATYYGGGDDDYGYSIVTDPSGNVFVTGWTESTDFPTYYLGDAYYQGTGGGSYTDAFILKFSNSGVRLWATYYGGSSYDYGYSIVTDSSGNVFVTGSTSSTGFPTYNPGGGAYYQGTRADSVDAFILKFSNSGVRLWATYYGGSDWDRGYSIVTDPSGNVFVTGYTYSTNFPTYNPGDGAYYDATGGGSSYDVFILKFSNSGVRLWATYYGGSATDYGSSIVTDPSGNVFVTGSTSSTDFPTYNPGGGAYYEGTYGGYSDVFILKFSNSGVRLWATYYGGTGVDTAYSIVTDPSGNVFITGYTRSTNFPTYNPGGDAYYQRTNAGYSDAFILMFSNSGVRLWATYYGGSSSSDYGYSIVTDPSGNVFVTGSTSSTDFPTYNPGVGAYYQRTRAGYSDAFVLKFETALDTTPPTTPTLVSPSNGSYLKSSSVTFMWLRSQDPAPGYGLSHYVLSYSIYPDFSISDSVITQDTFVTRNLPDTTYYWRVRAVDGAGNSSPWSEVWQFTIDTRAPDAPTLVYPINGVYVGGPDVVLKWSKVTKVGSGEGTKGSPVRYVVQVDTVSSFASPIRVDTVEVESLRVTLFDRYPFYWRVKAYDLAGNEGSYSSVGVFGRDLTPPTAPVLISPTNNSNTSNPVVTLRWRSSTDPNPGSGLSHYVLSYSIYSDFRVSDSVVTQDTFVTRNLPDTTYYWRVRAVDGVGYSSSWSEGWRFTVDTHAPDAPTLVYPINGGYVGSPDVVLKWSKVTKVGSGEGSGTKGTPVRYVVQVDTVSSFSSPIRVYTVEAESLMVTLFERYLFYWRVKAYDLAGNEGSYSDIGIFGVDLTPPTISNTTVWKDTTYAGPFEVKVRVLDNMSGIDSVLLYYKRNEDGNWISRKMRYSNGWYVDTIPAVTMVGDTVRYYIEAYDRSIPSNIGRDPINAPQSYYSFIANLMSGIVEGRPKEFGLRLKSNLGGNGVVFEVRIPDGGEVSLRIYEATGRLVDEPMSGIKRGGYYEVMWTGREGIYFYVLESKWGKRIGRFVITRRK
jgi:hypothetical protein